VGARGRDTDPIPEVDLALLGGFNFGCLPGCGLCCFASPRLDPDDAQRLERLAPTALIVRDGNERRLAARPDGGACQFLTDLRCGIHHARPAPCREFPISVHIGTRLQATVVLSCPGLGLDPLLSRSPGAPSRSFSGLDAELSSVHQRLSPAVERRRVEAERRRRRIARDLTAQGRWVDEEEVRRELGKRRLIPGPEEYSLEDPPTAEDGLEYLPMYYDGRAGPVALGRGLGGWEALEFAPEGGSRPVGLAVPPERRPGLDWMAEALLSGYLRYWLARDGFLSAVHLEMLSAPEGTVVEAVLADLHAIGSSVLARGAVRAKLRGEDGALLTAGDVALGIRATDQDWLDRPTWGSRL
jgi:putative zinc- or iron-chelating protein